VETPAPSTSLLLENCLLKFKRHLSKVVISIVHLWMMSWFPYLQYKKILIQYRVPVVTGQFSNQGLITLLQHKLIMTY
jgi:hypothetical protein